MNFLGSGAKWLVETPWNFHKKKNNVSISLFSEFEHFKVKILFENRAGQIPKRNLEIEESTPEFAGVRVGVHSFLAGIETANFNSFSTSAFLQLRVQFCLRFCLIVSFCGLVLYSLNHVFYFLILIIEVRITDPLAPFV